MFGNSWHKKEKPLLGLTGLGGGVGSNLISGLAATGMDASGGIIAEYTDPGGQAYRSHTFTSSGSFVVAELSSDPALNVCDCLLVGGGGGGGIDAYSSDRGVGGGGGGSVIYKEDCAVPGAASYEVKVGRGAKGGGYYPPGGQSGYKSVTGGTTGPRGTSSFNLPSGTLSAYAGGGGAGHSVPAQTPGPMCHGASGGGGPNGNPAGTGSGTDSHPGGVDVVMAAGWGWGNDGGAGNPNPSGVYTGGGGGGAETVGTQGSPTSHGPGGAGAQYTTATGVAQRYGGGGGGGGKVNQPGGAGGSGGGGAGSRSSGPAGSNGTPGLGGGGGAKGNYGSQPASSGSAYTGGDGTVVIRYKIVGSQVTPNPAGATGGHISFYGGKTIHTFLYGGNFVTPGSFSETCEYVVLGGGGGGGSGYAGGGGAGGYRTGTTSVGSSLNLTVQVGLGGKGGGICGNGLGGGEKGQDSQVNFPGGTVTGTGGGYGQTYDISPKSAGGPGGSGGGGGVGPGGSGNMGNPGPNNPSGQGNGGGAGHQASSQPTNAGGGGGGAGGGGAAGGSGTAGRGGAGVQLPATFQNPRSAPAVTFPGNQTVAVYDNLPAGGLGAGGPGTSLYYVAGGGGGGHGDVPNFGGSGGGESTGNVLQDWAGAGHGSGGPVDPTGDWPTGYYATHAISNTGSGGGGCGGGASDGESTPGSPEVPAFRMSSPGGTGGSGLVLIAYPT